MQLEDGTYHRHALEAPGGLVCVCAECQDGKTERITIRICGRKSYRAESNCLLHAFEMAQGGCQYPLGNRHPAHCYNGRFLGLREI
jgi:hypothetical protein